MPVSWVGTNVCVQSFTAILYSNVSDAEGAHDLSKRRREQDAVLPEADRDVRQLCAVCEINKAESLPHALIEFPTLDNVGHRIATAPHPVARKSSRHRGD